MAEIQQKERLPFPLAKPNEDTFVTKTTEIGHGNRPLSEVLDDILGEIGDSGELTQAITSIRNIVNSNSISIEDKVNALIDCINALIPLIVFHSGTPFNIPQTLSSALSLIRIPSGSTSSSARCNVAVCNKAICNTN